MKLKPWIQPSQSFLYEKTASSPRLPNSELDCPQRPAPHAAYHSPRRVRGVTWASLLIGSQVARMAGPPAACRYLENVRTPRSSPRMAPDCCDDGPLQRGGQNSYLENGHSIRYSDHMFTPCVAAAPTRHPPGEAHAAPRVLPPQTARVAQVAAPSGYLGGAAARGWITSSPIEQPLSPCRHTTTRQATPQLQTTQQLRPAVAQNASGDTGRHATKENCPAAGPLPLAVQRIQRFRCNPYDRLSRYTTLTLQFRERRDGRCASRLI